MSASTLLPSASTEGHSGEIRFADRAIAADRTALTPLSRSSLLLLLASGRSAVKSASLDAWPRDGRESLSVSSDKAATAACDAVCHSLRSCAVGTGVACVCACCGLRPLRNEFCFVCQILSQPRAFSRPLAGSGRHKVCGVGDGFHHVHRFSG